MMDESKIDKNPYVLIRLPNYFRGPKVILKTAEKDYKKLEILELVAAPLHF